MNHEVNDSRMSAEMQIVVTAVQSATVHETNIVSLRRSGAGGYLRLSVTQICTEINIHTLTNICGRAHIFTHPNHTQAHTQ